MVNKELPEGWKWVKFEDVCNIISGKNQTKVLNPDGKYPIYGSSGIFGFADEYLCNEGTTIIGRKGTINKPLFVKTKFWNVDTAFGLSAYDHYNNKLLYYFCLSFNFQKLDKSTTIPSLAKRDLLAIEIPLPPLPTQQAIVSKIEELFSELDKGVENLKTAQQQLKVYRQAVLKWAFEGKLTNGLNHDLSDLSDSHDLGMVAEPNEVYQLANSLNLDSDDLYDGHDLKTGKVKTFAKNQENQTNQKNQGADNGGLPEGWKWVTFKDVSNKIGDIDHKMPNQLSEGYPYVSTKDFTKDFKISFDNAKYISEEDYLNLSRKIKPERGDIIFPRYGTIGKNILIDFDKEFLVSYSCAVIKLDKAKVIDKYAYLYSLSPKITDEIRKYVVETTQANIGIASIKSFVFPLPSIEIQTRVVQEIERRLSVADKMEESIQQSLLQAESLRQSILKKAFEGGLVK